MHQNTAHVESPVKFTAPPPKPSKRRQKRTVDVHNKDAPRRTPWTNKEEILLRKGWVHASENSAKGKARKTDGFWIEVLAYLPNKTKQPSRRTYDMMNEKWKTGRLNVAQFCGVYANILRKAQDCGSDHQDRR
uniref:Myb-like domain-containing protein n=1 Tax=Tanacetum cinerariifolium TaxID=118510 RepID=A0A6L2KTB6_TANCI|nr:hypothetical protein [Tanacetum cinerariifolium]